MSRGQLLLNINSEARSFLPAVMTWCTNTSTRESSQIDKTDQGRPCPIRHRGPAVNGLGDADTPNGTMRTETLDITTLSRCSQTHFIKFRTRRNKRRDSRLVLTIVRKSNLPTPLRTRFATCTTMGSPSAFQPKENPITSSAPSPKSETTFLSFRTCTARSRTPNCSVRSQRFCSKCTRTTTITTKTWIVHTRWARMSLSDVGPQVRTPPASSTKWSIMKMTRTSE